MIILYTLINMKETVILSVGGSLINPGEIDVTFLKNLKNLIDKQDRRFILITGGGSVTRIYQKVAREFDVSQEDLDWIGIQPTRVNAHLLRAMFGDEAETEIIMNPTKEIVFDKKVIVSGGWKPGWSTDYVAMLLAKKFNVKKLINLSNIDYIYTDDPKKNPDATPIEKISWEDFRKLIPEEWTPGMHAPLDPVAAKEGEQLQIEVAAINGEKLGELENYLDGKEFIGTLIQ